MGIALLVKEVGIRTTKGIAAICEKNWKKSRKASMIKS